MKTELMSREKKGRGVSRLQWTEQARSAAFCLSS